jgi:asparagine synthase (glutamine-hydrolysing)
MCGLAGVLGQATTGSVVSMLDAQKHRGPDGRDIFGAEGQPFMLGHDRLAIIDVAGGHQPIANEDGTLWIAVNGEIYNHQELRRRLAGRHQFRTGSDSEVLLHLFEEEGPGAVRQLDGMFAAAIWGADTGLFLARDPLGIKPLYYGHDAGGNLCFASEIKSLLAHVSDVQEFPNGHYWISGQDPVPYYALPRPESSLGDEAAAAEAVANALIPAVTKRLMADVPLGVFLSGGLDSSLIAAIAREHTEGTLMSFSVGLEGSPDLINARRVAEYLGTEHHERVTTRAELIAALPRVVHHLESFDPALVRSAIPTYLVSELAAQHVKVVLSGEGADELFAGYHYLAELADDPEALNEELQLITAALHHSNLQRVDRMSMAHGLEARVPFLDLKVIETAFRIHPHLKLRGAGKWILRKMAERYLPHDIVWRRKEKFAIGTGIGQMLQQYGETQISDEELRRERQPDGGSFANKEALLYWRHFAGSYGRPDVLAGMGHSRSLNPGQRWTP